MYWRRYMVRWWLLGFLLIPGVVLAQGSLAQDQVVPGILSLTNCGTSPTPCFMPGDVCIVGAKVAQPISQAASSQIVTGTPGKKTYICSVSIVSADAENMSLVEGTGSVCATNTAAVIGSTTPAAGVNLAASSYVTGNGGATVAIAGNATGDNVCLLQSGTGRVAGVMTYVQN